MPLRLISLLGMAPEGVHDYCLLGCHTTKCETGTNVSGEPVCTLIHQAANSQDPNLYIIWSANLYSLQRFKGQQYLKKIRNVYKILVRKQYRDQKHIWKLGLFGDNREQPACLSRADCLA